MTAQINANFSALFTFLTSAGSPYVLTGASIQVDLKLQPGETPIATLSTENGELQVQAAPNNNQVLWTLNAEQMAAFAPGLYYWDMLQLIDENDSILLAGGTWSILTGITNSPTPELPAIDCCGPQPNNNLGITVGNPQAISVTLAPSGPPGAAGTGIRWLAGGWDAETAYFLNDGVGYQGSSWICIDPNTNEPPTLDSPYWDLIAAQGAPGAGTPFANSTTSLRALNTSGYLNGTAVALTNYFNFSGVGLPDPGGGELVWDATSITADDGFTAFQPNDVSGAGRLLRPAKPRFNAAEAGLVFEQFTTYNPGSTQATIDNLTQLVRAITFIAFIAPGGAVIDCPPGVMGVSDLPSNLMGTNGIFLEGKGRNQTVIQRLAGSTSTNPVWYPGSIYTSTTKVTSGGLRDLTLDGNGIAPCCLHLTSNDNFESTNVGYVAAAAPSGPGSSAAVIIDVVGSSPQWPNSNGSPGSAYNRFVGTTFNQSGNGFSNAGVKLAIRNATNCIVTGNSVSDTFKTSFKDTYADFWFGDGLYLKVCDAITIEDDFNFTPNSVNISVTGTAQNVAGQGQIINAVAVAGASLSAIVVGMQVRGPSIVSGCLGATNTTVTSVSGTTIYLSGLVNGSGATAGANAPFYIGGASVVVSDDPTASNQYARHIYMSNVQSADGNILVLDTNGYTGFTGVMSTAGGANLSQITGININTSALAVGWFVYGGSTTQGGAGLKNGGTIVSIDSSSQITVSGAAGGTIASGQFYAAKGRPAGPVFTDLNLGNQTTSNTPITYGYAVHNLRTPLGALNQGFISPLSVSLASSGPTASLAAIQNILYSYGWGNFCHGFYSTNNQPHHVFGTNTGLSGTFRLNNATGNGEFVFPGGTLLINGASLGVNGVIATALTPVSTPADTAAHALQSFAITSAFQTAGALVWEAEGTFGANADAKSLWFQFGSLIVEPISAVATNGGTFKFGGTIWLNGVGAQTYSATYRSVDASGAVVIKDYFGTTAQTGGPNITMAIHGQKRHRDRQRHHL